MYRVSLAAVLSAVGLAFAASPAAAEAPLNGPNCSGWFVSDAVNGIGAHAAAAGVGLSVQEAQELIHAGCADATSNAPRCEIGQGNAAQAALERGDLDKYMFHLGTLFNCFVGEPPSA